MNDCNFRLEFWLKRHTFSNAFPVLNCFFSFLTVIIGKLKTYQTTPSSPFNSTFYFYWASIVYGNDHATEGQGDGSRPATTEVNRDNEPMAAVAVPALIATSLHLPSSPPKSPSSPHRRPLCHRTPQVQGVVILNWFQGLRCCCTAGRLWTVTHLHWRSPFILPEGPFLAHTLTPVRKGDHLLSAWCHERASEGRAWRKSRTCRGFALQHEAPCSELLWTALKGTEFIIRHS
jgi:hypothetical protein